MNPVNIAVGWINVAREKIGIADDRTEALAKIRGEICLACSNVGRENIKCGICGCDVQAKIRVKWEKCPIEKW